MLCICLVTRKISEPAVSVLLCSFRSLSCPLSRCKSCCQKLQAAASFLGPSSRLGHMPIAALHSKNSRHLHHADQMVVGRGALILLTTPPPTGVCVCAAETMPGGYLEYESCRASIEWSHNYWSTFFVCFFNTFIEIMIHLSYTSPI